MNLFVPFAVTLTEVQRWAISKCDAAHYRRVLAFSRIVHAVDSVEGAFARIFPSEFFDCIPAGRHRFAIPHDCQFTRLPVP